MGVEVAEPLLQDGIPRGSYKGVVTVYYNEAKIFLAKSPEFKGPDPSTGGVVRTDRTGALIRRKKRMLGCEALKGLDVFLVESVQLDKPPGRRCDHSPKPYADDELWRGHVHHGGHALFHARCGRGGRRGIRTALVMRRHGNTQLPQFLSHNLNVLLYVAVGHGGFNRLWLDESERLSRHVCLASEPGSPGQRAW